MSQSIQGNTGFAIQFPSEQGMTRQNARLTLTRVLERVLFPLLCICLFAFATDLLAQPVSYESAPWRPPALTTDGSISNRSVWTDGDVTLTDRGGVYGFSAGRPANWWVTGDLNNWGTSGTRYLTNLTVEGNLDNRSEIYEVSHIRVDGNLTNNSTIRDGDSTGPIMPWDTVVPSTITVGGILTNTGTISNFTSVYASGLLNQGAISNVDSILVKSYSTDNLSEDGSLRNAGALADIMSITVANRIYLNEGTSLSNVGTVFSSNGIEVNGTVEGGFRVLDTAGQLTVRGSLLTINESVPAISGNLTVERGSVASGHSIINDGSIFNRGVLNSATEFRNSGRIFNEGTISSVGAFINSGTISGNGLVSVGGDERFQVLSRFQTVPHFENTSSGTIVGRLAVNGNFENRGGTLHLQTDWNNGAVELVRVTNGKATIIGGTVDTSEFFGVAGNQYLFLATDSPGSLDVLTPMGVTGNYQAGSVINFAPVYGNWNGTRYVAGRPWSDNQYYWLEMQRTYSYGPYADTPNRRAIGEYLDTIGTAPVRDSGLWNLFQQLDGISERAGVPHHSPVDTAVFRALDELSGMIYANLGAASVHNTGVVNRTLADVLRSDVFKFSMIGNPNNAIRGQAIAPLRYTRWGTLFGIGGGAQHDGNADGYRTSFGGAMVGVDRALWTGTRMGAYLSAAIGDVSMRDLNESSDITSVSVGMYLRQEMYYGYGLVAAGFGRDSYDTERYLSMLNHNATSKTDANIGTVYLERGIDIPVYYATLQPYTSFQVVSVHQDDFTETMRDQTGRYTVTPLGLEGVEGITNSFRMALGARASSQPIPMRWGQLALTTNMAWFHEFNGKNDRDFVARYSNPGGSNFGTQFSNTTFRIYGNDPKRDWLNFGLGFNVDRNSTRTFVGADLFANNRQTLFSGYGGFVTSW